VLATNPVRFAVVTPAAVEPVGVVPATGAVAEVETKYWYPEAGAGEAAVHDIVAEIEVTADDANADGNAHAGGVVTVKV
jgi:hypothetical protein